MSDFGDAVGAIVGAITDREDAMTNRDDALPDFGDAHSNNADAMTSWAVSSTILRMQRPIRRVLAAPARMYR
jgi:hypothetical protein